VEEEQHGVETLLSTERYVDEKSSIIVVRSMGALGMNTRGASTDSGSRKRDNW